MAYADPSTVLYVAVAILAALRRRYAAGRGARMDTALIDCQVGVLANQALHYLVSGSASARIGNVYPSLALSEFPLHIRDSIVAVGNNRQITSLCTVSCSTKFAAEERFKQSVGRVKERAVLTELLADTVQAWPRDKLAKKLEGAEEPSGLINGIANVFVDQQVAARGRQLMSTNEIPGRARPVVIDGERQIATGSPTTRTSIAQP